MLIKDETLKKALLRALADEEAVRVLECTTWKPKGVAEIVRECSIPHTSAYRLTNELKSSGLLIVERVVLTEDGKKSALYRSTFTSISAKLDRGTLEVEAELNKDTASKAFDLFYSFDERGKD